jgi:hypothetical protein
MKMVVEVTMETENILVWNLRGLNAQSHRDAVRELVGAERQSLVCFHETKVDVISDFDIMQILGLVLIMYSFLVHTRGGIFVTWRSTNWVVTNVTNRTYSVSAKVGHIVADLEWSLTTVCSLSRDEDKEAFL